MIAGPAAAQDVAPVLPEQAASPPETPEGDSLPETIDLGESPVPAAQPAPAAPAPLPRAASGPAPFEFRLRGWARGRGSMLLRGDDAVHDGGIEVPFEPMLGDKQLFLELRAQRERRFEVLASGLLAYTLAAHRQRGPTPADPYPRGRFEPSLREAYVGFIDPHIAARLGLQRIAWGSADAFPINDVINPRDLRDPLLAETDVLRIPTAALRLDLNAEAIAFQLAVAPFFVPDRVDVYGTNWSFIGPHAPAGMRGAFDRLSSSVDPSLEAPAQLLLRQTSLPRDDLSATALGLKASWSAGGFDVSHFYHYGYTTAPTLRIEPALAAAIATTDWVEATPEQVATLAAARQSGALTATYQRRHHVGLSATTAAGSFVLRGEAAYDSTQVFYEPTLLSVLRPAAQGVLGVEYQPGEVGKAIIVEAMVQRILGERPPPLLGASQQTYGAAAILRWSLASLEGELRTVASLEPYGVTVRPQLTYRHGIFEVRGGVLWLEGDATSRERYFRRNSSVYMIGKASF